jgi:hypothetical protein
MPKRSKRTNDAYKELCRCFCAGKSANNLSGHKRVRLPCGGAMVTFRTFLNHQKANTNDRADLTFVDSDTEDVVEAHFNAGYIFICVLSIYIYIINLRLIYIYKYYSN